MNVDNTLGQLLERYHYDFQLGMYFSGVKSVIEARLLYSEIIDDNYWNYASEILTIEERVERLITTSERFYSQKGRSPAFYITPWTKPSNLTKILAKRGYSMSFDDAWVVARNVLVPDISPPRELKIIYVRTWKQISTFVETFMSAFGYVSEDVPYGGLPKTYGEALRRSMINNIKNENFIHYLALWNDIPVGVGSLAHKAGIAGLYNLGVKAEFRNRGIGKFIAIKRIDDAVKAGNEILFFQSEPGGIVEKFYHSFGFSTEFIGECWTIEH